MKKIITAVTVSITLLTLMGASLKASDLTTDNLTVNNDAQIAGTLNIGPVAGVFPSNGLALYYNFDTNTTPVPDLSGLGRTGTVSGATWVTNGVSGGGYSFDGVNDYINAGRLTELEGATNYTIAYWVKQTNSSGLRIHFTYDLDDSCGSSPNLDSYIFWYNDGGVLRYGAATSSEGDFTVAMTNGAWHHIVLIRTNNTVYGYDNGSYLSQFTASTSITGGSTYKLRLGPPMNANAFAGIMDEFIVYSRALSSSEVSGFYNSYFSQSESTNAPIERLHVQGTSRLDGGVSYVGRLGDVDMGVYTNKP